MLTYALPDQPRAADLEERGDDEEGGGAEDEHAVQLSMRVQGVVRHLMGCAWGGPRVGYIPYWPRLTTDC
ncbi:hypothetical protein GCM10022232_90830 [Streptomyces plumbiresistens]|uniref:Uncharacterized protein n=1 Tax=Streptomyces plumbiresistens TaxID=511811 RepID=A0ABP7TSX7_9ACTN